ncbi:MAG: hypothetical protein PUA68_04430 [Bacilli bacterium]|nr:hypothetical protein [Bacilli bacterium]
MKIIKINNAKNIISNSIKNSMNNTVEIIVANNLDACSCTGNDFC